MLAISIAWIPVITKYSNAQLFVYVQVVSNFFQPPIAAVFVLAMLWHRLTEKVIFFHFFLIFPLIFFLHLGSILGITCWICGWFNPFWT